MTNWINEVIIEILNIRFPDDVSYVESKTNQIKDLNIYESLFQISKNFDTLGQIMFCEKTNFTKAYLEAYYKIWVKF